MKHGIKALFITLALAGATCSLPVHAAPSTNTQAAQSKTESASAARDKANEKVSINTAPADELARVLNGVGLKKAQAIGRTRNGRHRLSPHLFPPSDR
jgi:competence protein ComEA